MKKLFIFQLLLMPVVCLAQNYQGMSDADMQKMMQQMEKMQNCMEDIDTDRLEALEQKSRQMETEVKSLCAKGKRDEAQKKALSFGKEISNDRTMKTIRKCGEMMKDVMPEITFTGLDKENTDRHICD
jgi:hypothetical protein